MVNPEKSEETEKKEKTESKEQTARRHRFSIHDDKTNHVILEYSMEIRENCFENRRKTLNEHSAYCKRVNSYMSLLGAGGSVCQQILAKLYSNR